MVVAKQCWDCKEVKPLEAFGVSRRNGDGLNSMCKACNARRAKDIRDRKPKKPKPERVPKSVHVKAPKVVLTHKECSDCKVVFPRAAFRLNGNSVRRSNCSDCQRERARLRRLDLVYRVSKLKLAAGCKDCGYNSHAEALDLDHLPGFEKKASVSELVANGRSWDLVSAEIAKCEVVCANCHRVRTANRRKGEASE